MLSKIAFLLCVASIAFAIPRKSFICYLHTYTRHHSLRLAMLLCFLRVSSVEKTRSLKWSYLSYIVRSLLGPYVPEGSSDNASICLLPPVSQDTRRCRGFFPRWTYETTTKSCTGFLYGGCGGTENLFETEFACLAKCNKEGKLFHIDAWRFVEMKTLILGLEKLIKQSDPTSQCMQPKAEGLCRAVIPSFFFDVQTGKCTLFDFSGCYGNDNRFASGEECEQACYHYPTNWQYSGNPPSTSNSSTVAVSGKLCMLSFRCWTHLHGWFNWNSWHYFTLLFSFHAVGLILGSVNEDVQEEMQDFCSLPVLNPGPKRCKINSQGRWTYNSKTGRCDMFEYIACSSVDPPNLFLSEFACLAKCNKKGTRLVLQF